MEMAEGWLQYCRYNEHRGGVCECNVTEMSGIYRGFDKFDVKQL